MTHDAARPQAWTFHITTFGCKVNQYESQAIAEAWLLLGGRQVASYAEADVTLINSCAVTAKGERDARNAVYRLRREAPAAKCLLTGCATALVRGRLVGQGAGQGGEPLYVPTRAKSLLLHGPWGLPDVVPDTAPPFGVQGFRIHDFGRARAVVKVQDGCSHRCTYCIVPLMRGPSISRAPGDVLAEVGALMAAGFGEIMLSGINLGQYGRGEQYGDFWDLLSMLDRELAPRFAGRARLRVSSLEPTQLDARGLDTLCAGRLLCPHVHLALQHGSPQVLRRMGRGHCRPHRLIAAVAELRKHWPVMGLGADILMGFPGEGEDDVRATLDVIAALGLTYAHVFPYSMRPGTAAAAFAGQVPHAEKAVRAKMARDAVEAQKQAFAHSLCALPELTVVEDAGPEGSASRAVSEHYAPCRIVGADPSSQACTHASQPKGLLRVRPTGVSKGAVLVRPI